MIYVLQYGMGTESNKGGIEQYLINQYRCLDGNDVHYDFISHTDEEMAFSKEIKSKGSVIYKLRERKKNPLLYYWDLLMLTLSIHNKYDAFIMNTGNYSQGIIFLFMKLANIKRRIIHSHAVSQEYDVSFFRNMLFIINKVIISIYATDNWACSNDAAKAMFGNKKAVVIKNAIDVKKFQYNEVIRNKIRKYMNLEDDIVIGMVARFSPIKNHDFLIDIFNMINVTEKKYKLLLIGNYNTTEFEEYMNDIYRKIEKYNIKDKIIFHSFTDKISDLYQAMDIFILPSIKEGLSLVTIEAQAAGLPCIISTGIPSDAVIVKENVKRISLDDGKYKWVECIENINLVRDDKSQEVINARFDIYSEVKRIKELLK